MQKSIANVNAIKLITKKHKDKRIVKNWRPISSLNIDTKILFKSLPEKMKHVPPELIFSNQTFYLKHRCISENGRLISYVIEMSDILDIPGYLVTFDIEKAFDSLDHGFLFSAFKKFRHWIKALLKNQ